ncbi:thioesterase [Streptomyces sp. IMTB 2501]|uniref:thioesterase II family protein n=1 Tax=Streptomyces sp. IMTB 2501 TaxID=1776340 RepID=UPI00096E8BB3|nr:alpha/beta fold hydrolase [Streptomyces sp. IMTB 2501]OLZ59426.1 thioesterase [Streptomyces sp. IMTB 2501]
MTANLTDTSLWIRRFHPAQGAPARLLCLPHAGGSAPFYFPVSQALSPGLDVLAVQYPGRQDRHTEPCIESLPELADALIEQVLPWTDRPLALFGHSMGASLAFELALRLERRGTVPLVVFASGRRAPSRHRDETVHLRDDAGLVAELRALSGTDARVFGDEELLRMVLPAIRSDYKAAETYRHTARARLAAPIHVHVGTDDPKATLDEARAWGEHTESEFEMHVYPGGHFYLNNHAPRVISAISQQISSLLPQQG